MIRPHDTVVLTTDLPMHQLCRGDLGTVLLVHGDRGYEVEFSTVDGQTITVLSLSGNEVRATAGREIAHARLVGVA